MIAALILIASVILAYIYWDALVDMLYYLAIAVAVAVAFVISAYSAYHEHLKRFKKSKSNSPHKRNTESYSGYKTLMEYDSQHKKKAKKHSPPKPEINRKKLSNANENTLLCECIIETKFLDIKDKLTPKFINNDNINRFPRGLLDEHYGQPFFTKNYKAVTVDELDSAIATFYHIALALNIHRYIEPLLRKKLQLCEYDDYGDLINEKWIIELIRFTEEKWNHLTCRNIIPADVSYLFRDIDNLVELYEFDKLKLQVENFHELAIAIDRFLTKHYEGVKNDTGITASTYISELNKITNPYEYEKEVGVILSSMGWKVKVTPSSGDQGVDVAAEFDSTRLVIQCKLHSQPVGNKAIQEVYAGKGFMRYTHAAVVTNNTFTKSARQLAHSLDVILIEQNNILHLHNTLTK